MIHWLNWPLIVNEKYMNSINICPVNCVKMQHDNQPENQPFNC